MDSILTGNVWKQVAAVSRGAKRRLAAVAYVSSGRFVKFRRGDVLICDASDRAIQSGETSALLLKSLHRRGVELRSRADLHAKVVVLGKYALVGSCNLSASSEEELAELALLSDRSQVLAQAAAFIHSLRQASDEIDSDFIRRIAKIRVRRARGPGRKRTRSATRLGNRVWVVSVQQLPEDSFPKEQPFVEKGEKKAETLIADKDATVSWIRCTGKSRFRNVARPGDIVLQIWKSLSGKRTTVFAPCPIVFRQDVAHWTRFYVAERDDCQSLSWERFKKETKKYGLSRISKDSVRELNAREVLLIEGLWK